MKNNSSNGIGAKQSMPPDLELLTPKEAAGFLRLSESFLAKARMRGDGPRYRKLSRSVRYLRADLLLWLKACGKTSTAERFQDDRQHYCGGFDDKSASPGTKKNVDLLNDTYNDRS
jgi:Helix-turn-helix domain